MPSRLEQLADGYADRRRDADPRMPGSERLRAKYDYLAGLRAGIEMAAQYVAENDSLDFGYEVRRALLDEGGTG